MEYQNRKINQKKIILITIIIISIILIILISLKIKQNKNIREENSITENSSFPDNVYGVPVKTELIEINTQARTGTKRKIKYIVIHETSNYNEGAGAENHSIFIKNNNTKATSWHYTVDDKEIYHHIPDNEIANHAGDATGNKYGIGIELCVNEDGDFEKTFENAAKLVAYLLKEYNLKIKDVKTHNEFSGKDCPHIILENNKFDEFKNEVEYYYKNK